MIRIVLDTNVLVSALLSPAGTPAGILNLLLHDRLLVLHDPRILAEYRDVLARPKFSFTPELVDPLLAYIHYRGEPVAAEPLLLALPDEGDRKFLEVARTGQADFLITGNKTHFPVEPLVVSPGEFLAGY